MTGAAVLIGFARERGPTAEVGEERAPVAGRSCGGGAVDVGTAVDAAGTELHGQERTAFGAQPARPAGDARYRGVIGDEPPAQLTQEARFRAAEEGVPHGRVDAVRAYHQVVGGGGAVREGHGPVVGRRRHLGVVADGSAVDGWAQHLVQIVTGDRQAGSDPTPDPSHLELRERPPAVVVQPLPRHGLRPFGHLVPHSDALEHPHGVCRKDGFHVLRHTCASIMLEAGESVVTLARRLGHSSPAVTLGYYAHLMPEAGSKGRNAIDGLLGKRGEAHAGRSSPDSPQGR